MRYIAMQLRLLLHSKFPDAHEDDILKIVGNLVYYRYMNPAIVAPDAFDIIDVSVEQQLTPEQVCVSSHPGLVTRATKYTSLCFLLSTLLFLPTPSFFLSSLILSNILFFHLPSPLLSLFPFSSLFLSSFFSSPLPSFASREETWDPLPRFCSMLQQERW